jgi:hypothetical protein
VSAQQATNWTIRGSTPARGEILLSFITHRDRFSAAPVFLSTWVASLAIKRPERGADHTLPSNVVVNKEWRYTCTALTRLNVLRRKNFALHAILRRKNFALHAIAEFPKTKKLTYLKQQWKIKTDKQKRINFSQNRRLKYTKFGRHLLPYICFSIYVLCTYGLCTYVLCTVKNNYYIQLCLNFVTFTFRSWNVTRQRKIDHILLFFRAVPLFCNPHTFEQRDLVENTEGGMRPFVQTKKKRRQ